MDRETAPSMWSPNPPDISTPDPIEPEGTKVRSGPPRRWATVLLLAAVVLLSLLFNTYRHLTSSLAQLEGSRIVVGLDREVIVDRDALGIPTIRGTTRADVARALGFIHAQERFFQMDLQRRKSAGELAALFGEGAVALDRQTRVHRFRVRATRVLESFKGADLAIADAYSNGVNAGLESLDGKPMEYFLLGVEPEPWTPVDIVLVVYSMYLDLNDADASRESAGGVIYDLLGPEMHDFLLPLGTTWDAPIDNSALERPSIPRPEVFDLREINSSNSDVNSQHAQNSHGDGAMEGTIQPSRGSNSWAIAGSHSADGRALLANDMHLGLGVPNIWYRAALHFQRPESPHEIVKVAGVTLPGVPFIIAGSNESVGWGFTNSYGDWTDLVVLEETPGEPDSYRTPNGLQKFEIHNEIIEVREGESESLEVEETIWGPVIDRDHLGRKRALRWIAHDPQGVTFAYRDLESAATLEEAIEAANRVGSPPQNVVIATATGRIGWTILGSIPRRFGHNGRLPVSWADGQKGWDGWLLPDDYPRILDPPSGRLWTANARAVGGEMMHTIGVGDYPLGARAQQIRDALKAGTNFSEEDLLQIQLDNRALFLERWQELLLRVLTPEAIESDHRREQLRKHVVTWGGRASIDSVGYRMVRAYRTFLTAQILEAITAECVAADDRFRTRSLFQREGPIWQLLSERPAHFLDPEYDSWDAALLAAVDETLDYFVKDGSSLEDKTWGDRNTVKVRHPMSRFIPGASRWLDMPPLPLPGDSHMPRVQSPFEGASQRFVVSPGREDSGIFHMPAGQSGHPLSPHYRDGHQAWARGEPTPFLPGKTLNRLTLLPGQLPGQ